MAARERGAGDLGVAEEGVVALAREKFFEQLRRHARSAQQDDHRERVTGPLAVERHTGDQRGPDRKRTRVRKVRDPVREAVEPRRLEFEEPLDRPAVGPARDRQPVGHDEQRSQQKPAQAGKQERTSPTRNHHVRAYPREGQKTAANCGPAATLARLWPPSSRGLGRRPLTAETGVRIPVAVLPEARSGSGFLSFCLWCGGWCGQYR